MDLGTHIGLLFVIYLQNTAESLQLHNNDYQELIIKQMGAPMWDICIFIVYWWNRHAFVWYRKWETPELNNSWLSHIVHKMILLQKKFGNCSNCKCLRNFKCFCNDLDLNVESSTKTLISNYYLKMNNFLHEFSSYKWLYCWKYLCDNSFIDFFSFSIISLRCYTWPW